MDREKKIQMIKAVCWFGVAADGLWTVALVWPELYTIFTGRAFGGDDLTTRLIAGIAASLMAGWTVLLAWTAQNPIERRDVLAFTAIPVVAGLFGLTLVGHFLEQGRTGWILFKQLGCSLLCCGHL